MFVTMSNIGTRRDFLFFRTPQTRIKPGFVLERERIHFRNNSFCHPDMCFVYLLLGRGLLLVVLAACRASVFEPI